MIFVHVEVQAEVDQNFPRRMFQYNNRIYERFEGEEEVGVTSLAVLADGNPAWRPDRYERSELGTSLQFQFVVAKLLDVDVRCDELLQKGQNPFAWVVRGHLDSLATRGATPERLLRKVELVRQLYQAGFSEAVVRDLVVFFDWVLTLPKELEERFQQKLGEMEGVMGREYVPTWERKAVHEGEKRGREEGRQEGREEGREEGRQEGRQEAVVSQIARALEKRLNGGSQPFVAAITHLTDGERTELFDLLLDTTDAEKIRAWFAVHPVKNSSRH